MPPKKTAAGAKKPTAQPVKKVASTKSAASKASTQKITKKSTPAPKPISSESEEEEQNNNNDDSETDDSSTPQTPTPSPQQTQGMPLDTIVEKLLLGLAQRLCNESSSLPNVTQLRNILINWAEYLPHPALRSHVLENVKHYNEVLRTIFYKEYLTLNIKPFANATKNGKQSTERLQELSYGTSSAFQQDLRHYNAYLQQLIDEQCVDLIPTDIKILQQLQKDYNKKMQTHQEFSERFCHILMLILAPAPFTFNDKQRISMQEIQFDYAYKFVIKYISYQPQFILLTTFSSILLPKLTAYMDSLPINGTPRCYNIISKVLIILCLMTQPYQAEEQQQQKADGNIQISTSLPTKYSKLLSAMQQSPALLPNTPPRGISWFHLFFEQYRGCSSLIQSSLHTSVDEKSNNNNDNNDANNNTSSSSTQVNPSQNKAEHTKNVFTLTKFRLNLSTLYIEMLLQCMHFVLLPNTLYLSAFARIGRDLQKDGNNDDDSDYDDIDTDDDNDNNDDDNKEKKEKLKKNKALRRIEMSRYTLLNTQDYKTYSRIIQYTPYILLQLTPYMLYLISMLTPQLQPQVYLNTLHTIKVIYILSMFNHLSTSLQYYTLLYSQILTNKTTNLLLKYHPFYSLCNTNNNNNVNDIITMLKTSIISLGKVLQYVTQHCANALLPPEFQQLCSYRINAQLKINTKLMYKRTSKLTPETRLEKLPLIQAQKQSGLLFNNVDTHMVTFKELFNSKILLSPFIDAQSTKLIPLQQSLLHELLLTYIRRYIEIADSYQRNGGTNSSNDKQDNDLLKNLSHQERLKFTLLQSTLRHQTKWLTTMATTGTTNGDAGGSIASLLQLESNDNNALHGMLHYLLEDNLSVVQAAQQEAKRKANEGRLKTSSQKTLAKLRTELLNNPDAIKNDDDEEDMNDILQDRVIKKETDNNNGDDDEDDLFSEMGQSVGYKVKRDNNDSDDDEQELVASLEDESLFIVKRQDNVLKKFGMTAAETTTDEDDDEDDEGSDNDDDKNNTQKSNKKIKNEKDLLSFMNTVTDELAEYNQFEVDDVQLAGVRPIDGVGGGTDFDNDDFGDIAIVGMDNEEEGEDNNDDEEDDNKITQNDNGDDSDDFMMDISSATTGSNNNIQSFGDDEFGEIVIMQPMGDSDEEEEEQEENKIKTQHNNLSKQLFSHVDNIFTNAAAASTSEESDVDDDKDNSDDDGDDNKIINNQTTHIASVMKDDDDDQDNRPVVKPSQKGKAATVKKTVVKKTTTTKATTTSAKSKAKKMLLEQEELNAAFTDDLSSILQQTGQLDVAQEDTAEKALNAATTTTGKKIIKKKPTITSAKAKASSARK